MGEGKGYRVEPFGGNRQMVAAAAAVNKEKNTIHLNGRAAPATPALSPPLPLRGT